MSTDAIPAVTQAAAADPADSSEAFDRLIRAGIAARSARDYAAAREHFQAACALRPASAGARCELAFTCIQAGLLDEAEASYRAVLEAEPANASAQGGLGLVAKRRGDAAGACALLAQAVTQHPEHPGLRLELAHVLRDLGRPAQAAVQYGELLARDPHHVDALVGLALIERRRVDHAAALTLFQRAAAQQPEHAGVQAEVAYTLRQLGRLDEAHALYQHAAEAQPQDPAPWRGLSLVALERGDPDAALAHARAACARDSTGIDSRLLLSALLREQGQLDEAAAVLAGCLAQLPDHPGACAEQGRLWRARGAHEPARAAFERAAQADPAFGNEVAAELLALGRPQPARAAFEQVLQRLPGDAGALQGLAELELLGGDHAAALARSEELIAAAPHRVEGRLLKCRALIQLDRADEAVALAATLVPDPAPPGVGDGAISSGSRTDPGAQTAPADAAHLEILRTCGRRAEAYALLAQPRVARTRHFGLWLEAVLTRLAFYDLDGAQEALRNPPARRAFEHSRVAYVRAMLADAQWRIDDAIAGFEQALAQHGADPGAHHHLARLHLLRADGDAVQRHLVQMLGQSASALALRGASANLSQSLIGQLYNELRLDPALMATLAQLADLAAPARIEPLLQIVRTHPDATPPALALLLALRQAGALAGAPTAAPTQDRSRAGAPARIPRRIVQYWNGTVPPAAVTVLLHTWVEAHPGYLYCRHDDATARAYLDAHHAPEVLHAYRRAAHPAQASDIFRLAWLQREGGFYVDADDRCLGHLLDVTPADACFLAYQEIYATVGNNFIACVPDEPVITRALNLAVEAMERGDADSIWLATGPGLLTRAYAQELAAQGADWAQWLITHPVLDRSELARVASPHGVLQYKNTRRGWLQRDFKSLRRGMR